MAGATALSAKHWGPSASQEFFITLAEPVAEAAASLASETALRNTLKRHRCRLAFLDASASRRPVDPLASFALSRVRVRIVGPDEAAIHRCCRQLALRFPTFAVRSAAWETATTATTSGNRRRLRHRRWGPGLISNDLLLPLTARDFAWRPAFCLPPPWQRELSAGLQLRRPQRWHRLEHWPVPKPKGRSGSDILDWDVGGARRKRCVGPCEDSAIDDNYSAFFTDSRSDKARQPSLGGSNANSVGSSTGSCATLIISIDCGKSVGSAEPPEAAARPHEGLKYNQLRRRGSSGSRKQKTNEGAKPVKCSRPDAPRVSHACVQTTPEVTASAGDNFSNCQPAQQIPSDLPLLAEKPHSNIKQATSAALPAATAVQIASQEPIEGRQSDKDQTGSAGELQQGSAQAPAAGGGRLRGKLAHRRVTWFLRSSRQRFR